MKFKHKISKGSRFNQIYIPKEVEEDFEVGDLVEVKLLKKKTKIYYSKNLPKLSDFKENIVKKIFSTLEQFNEIKQIFVIGSFLTQKINYNDIDIILITNKKELEEVAYDKLTDKINLKFHIISISEDNFSLLQETCPLTNNMIYYYLSNKNFNPPNKRKIDKNHIKFLIMLPEDLLEIKTNSHVFYDSIRRLITIRKFLKNEDLDPIKINKELELTLGTFTFSALKDNEIIDTKIIEKLRDIIKNELNNINKLIQNEQNKNHS